MGMNACVQYADSNVVIATAAKVANENSELLARLGDGSKAFLGQDRATPAYGSTRAPSPEMRDPDDCSPNAR